MKIFFYFFIFFACSSQAFQVWTPGEKTFETKPSGSLRIDLELAGNESAFFIVELDKKFEFKKNAKPVEIHFSKSLPVHINSYWLLGEKNTNSSVKSGLKTKSKNDWVGDVLVPTADPNLPSLVDKMTSSKSQLLIELRADSNQKTQERSEILTLKSDQFDLKVPIRIKFYQWTLPTNFQLKTSFGFSPWAVLQKHGQQYRKQKSIYDLYFKLARDHRIDLHKIYPEIATSLVEPLKATLHADLSFENTWASARGDAGALSRMTGTDLPVPEKYKFPVAADLGDAEIYWKALNRSASSLGNTYVYFMDEPSADKIKEAIPHLKRVKKWAPNIKILVVSNFNTELAAYVDIWCPNLFLWQKPNFPSPNDYLKLKKEGREFWVYVSCNSHGCTQGEDLAIPDFVIDRSSAWLRSFPWIADKLGAEGILYYDTVKGYEVNDKSPWIDPFLFHGLGEGNLFYPCPVKICGVKNPVVYESLRLKILRDGLEDVEIFRSAVSKVTAEKQKKLVGERDLIFSSVHKWSKNIEDYENLKKQSLEILNGH